MSRRQSIVQSAFAQYHEDYYYKPNNNKQYIFISTYNSARVSPSPQEQMKLLTHEGTKHHHDCIMNVKWMNKRAHMQIHNYEFRNYNEMDEGFVDVDGGDGGVDDGDRCRGIQDHNVDGDGSPSCGFPLRIPSGV